MKPRTLLLVTYHFPPSAASGSFRLLGFARHLSAHGWRTVVVAPPRMPFEEVDENLGRQVPADTVVYSVSLPRGNRLTRRVAPFAAWIPAALKACGRAVATERPDALLTSSPPHTIHVIGRLLKARYGLPWVVDYRDPWAYGLAKPLPPTWRTRLEKIKEKMALRAADGIVVNTPLAREALLREVPEFAAKMTVITNGFDPQNFLIDPEPLEEPATISIVHTGELYSGRDPRPLFDALASMQPSPHTKPVRLTFLGQSSDPRHDWPAEARRFGLTDIVQFTGHVSYDEALRRMRGAGILLLLDTAGRRVGIPAKLFEYFGARRPILALAEPRGDVAWALSKSGVPHRLAAPVHVGQIRQALHELLSEVTRSPAAACQPIAAEFTRAHMAARLASFLNQTVSPRRSSSSASEPTPELKLPATSWAASGCAAWQQPHGVLP